MFEYLGLNDDIVQNYFLARAKRCPKEDAVAFDSSTVSSYSRYIKETRQGFNKAGDGLDTVKLLTLFDLATLQPIAFAREPGNLADVSGIENALKQFSFLNISKAQIVTDKGYYSQNNIGQMQRKHIKFLTAASIDLSWVNYHLQKISPAWKQPLAFVLGTSIFMESLLPSMPSLLIRDSATEVRQPRARLSVKQQGGYTI